MISKTVHYTSNDILRPKMLKVNTKMFIIIELKHR